MLIWRFVNLGCKYLPLLFLLIWNGLSARSEFPLWKPPPDGRKGKKGTRVRRPGWWEKGICEGQRGAGVSMFTWQTG